MSVEEIINIIAPLNSSDYKCFNLLKDLLNNNDEFKNMVIEGITTGNITGFSEELWQKLANQNMRSRGVNNFLEVLKDGYNIGYCTVASKQVSYSLNSCYICGGVLPIIKGTTNCVDGSHTWIEFSDWIIDTSLMLCISKDYQNKFGYIEENRYNPNLDSNYLAAKDFTNDDSLRRKN